MGRDRQVLLAHHPGIEVILPTEQGVGRVRVQDLVPFATAWSPGQGSVPFAGDS
ncbi:hypothetical protein [Streptomyces albus]|uniref:hypothetical protein n=1 Tax=Streptomyces albus TaxID=1888 RepID=UPI001A9B6782|nr:hypothetical protein [Streptomyces albus]